MKQLNTVISKKRIEAVKCDLLVVFAAQDNNEKLICDKTTDFFLSPAEELEEFSGKKDQSLLLYPPYDNKKKYSGVKRCLVVGLGKITGEEPDEELFETFRVAGGIIAKVCTSSKASNLGIRIPSLKNLVDADFCEHVIEGLQLGIYQFTNYKKADEDSYQGLGKVTIHTEGKEAAIRQGLEKGKSCSAAGNNARDMANEPGNGWTPIHFAKYGKKLEKIENVTCTVIEEKEMKKLGMGGILGVNKGSHEPPKLVVLDYCPEKYKQTIMFVGKGLTFDSGGISLKPAQGMMDMKYDMCGGAAAICSVEAIAREKLPVRIISLIPSTDNMSGGGAVKPGDVITHYGGITSEIENTDAEGRLILADALAYGIETFTPDCVIDLATLTGAVIIALGHHHSGILSNSDQLTSALIKAGERAGEPLWRLPLGPLYAKQIKSKVAEIKNTGGRPAGTITAAEYLHKFVGETPWAHIDIAGTAWDFTEKSYIPKGPSGIGTRTLIELVRNWKSGTLNSDR